MAFCDMISMLAMKHHMSMAAYIVFSILKIYDILKWELFNLIQNLQRALVFGDTMKDTL